MRTPCCSESFLWVQLQPSDTETRGSRGPRGPHLAQAPPRAALPVFPRDLPQRPHPQVRAPTCCQPPGSQKPVRPRSRCLGSDRSAPCSRWHSGPKCCPCVLCLGTSVLRWVALCACSGEEKYQEPVRETDGQGGQGHARPLPESAHSRAGSRLSWHPDLQAEFLQTLSVSAKKNPLHRTAPTPPGSQLTSSRCLCSS